MFRALSWIPSRVAEFFRPARLTQHEGVAKRARDLRASVLGITREQGDLLYTLVRLKRPRLVVEFGASMGISTLYLSAALADNGHGEMITTELDPEKCRRVGENLEEAGLQSFVDVRVGDARETLKSVDREIDFLFLDGWKALYLPVLSVVENHITSGSTILADDTRKYRRRTGPFMLHMEDPKSGYATVELNIGHGMSLSVRN